MTSPRFPHHLATAGDIGVLDGIAGAVLLLSGGLLVASPDGVATVTFLATALLAAVASPMAATAAVIVALPFTYRPVQIGSSEFGPLELSIAMLTVSRGIQVFRGGSLHGWSGHFWSKNGLGLPAFAFLAAATFSLTTVADPAHRHESLREYRLVIVEPILVYLLMRPTLRSHHGQRFLGGTLIASGTVVAICAVGQFTLGLGVAADGVHRATVTYPHPNNLSFYLERVGAFAAGAALMLRRPRWRAIRLGTALIISLGVGATFSRGAMIGLIVGVATLALLTGQRRGAWIPVLSAVVIAALFFGALASGRLVDLGGTGRWPTRFLIWRASWAMALDHPIWGVGLDQFLYQYWRRYVEPGGWPERYSSHPHNLVLDLWLRVGILGAVAFGWLFTGVARLVRRHLAHGDLPATPFVAGAMAAIVAGLTHGLVDNGFFLPDVAVMTWLFIAVLEAASHDLADA